MKKTIAFILALTAVAVSYSYAQDIDLQQAPDSVQVIQEAAELLPVEELDVPKVDKQIFNHLAVGVPIDFPFLPDGIGIVEVATTLTPHLQLRAGYSMGLLGLFTPSVNDIRNLSPQLAQQIPSEIDYNGKKINIGDSKFNLSMNTGGFKFFLDVYPGKKAGFHFTFGAFVNNPNAIQVKADLSTALKDAGFAPGRYNEVYFGLSDEDPTFRISPDQNGVVTAGLHTWAIRPYVGLGFGRAIDPDRRVCVSFDMGAFFWGSPILVANDYSLNPEGRIVAFTQERLMASKDLKSLAEPMNIVSKVCAYPVMKLNIFIRVF